MTTGEVAIRVRYAETDRMGLLHHANYLVYFEQARTELLRSLGLTYKDMEDQGFSAGCHQGGGPLPPAGPLRRPADDPNHGRQNHDGAHRPPL